MPQDQFVRRFAENVPCSIGSIIRDSSITQPIQRVPGITIEMAVTLSFAREKQGKTTFLKCIVTAGAGRRQGQQGGTDDSQ